MWPRFDPPLTSAERTLVGVLAAIALFAGYVCGRVVFGL